MDDTLALLSSDLQERLRRYAAIASYFRGNLPRSLNDNAGLITAEFLAAFVHEEQINKRLGATHITLGKFVESDRGESMATQIHSGKQARATISATDVDGAPADVSGATATSADETQVTARVEGNEVIVTDVPNSNLGPVDVTITVGSAVLVETIEVVAGDAVAVNTSAFVEEDRPA